MSIVMVVGFVGGAVTANAISPGWLTEVFVRVGYASKAVLSVMQITAQFVGIEEVFEKMTHDVWEENAERGGDQWKIDFGM